MSACRACGAELPDGARFCPACGTPLEAGVHLPSRERKIVTTLFCDVVGFTRLSENADPEDVDRMLREYAAVASHAVEIHGGIVEKFIGDAVVAVFGVPTAHEDDAERAVRAGLRMQDRLLAFCRETGVEVQLRVGVNTGEVLVGSLRAGASYTAMGDVVNTADRYCEP